MFDINLLFFTLVHLLIIRKGFKGVTISRPSSLSEELFSTMMVGTTLFASTSLSSDDISGVKTLGLNGVHLLCFVLTIGFGGVLMSALTSGSGNFSSAEFICVS